ncbi:MAG: hypothetical protein ACRBDI_07480 [Alphaproteobacteria bacterium]
MSLALLTKDFRQVAHELKKQELVYPVELKTFRQVLEPVHDLMVNYEVHHNVQDITVRNQLKYLRQTCLDLQVARTDIDPQTKKQQNKLLDSLQNLMEDVEDAANVEAQYAQVNYKDLFNLSQLSDIIRGDADICNNEMKRELGNVIAFDLSTMLNKVADRFDAAQARRWQPKVANLSVDLDAAASNDAEHDQPDVA